MVKIEIVCASSKLNVKTFVKIPKKLDS